MATTMAQDPPQGAVKASIMVEVTYRKIALRLMPLLALLFLLAWIDLVNVDLAKLQIFDDLQFSEAVYGLGTGIFFIGYFLFEVPGHQILERFSACRTLARGCASINSVFMTSFVVAGLVGGLLAGLIVAGMEVVGRYSSWQWLLLADGAPSVLAGIAQFGLDDKLQVGLMSLTSFILGTLAMLWSGSRSDRPGERRLHCVPAILLAALGRGGGVFLVSSVVALCSLSLSAISILAAVFWPFTAELLTGTAAVGAIASVSFIANLAGFSGPYLMGFLKAVTGSVSSGLYTVTTLQVVIPLLVLVFVRRGR